MDPMLSNLVSAGLKAAGRDRQQWVQELILCPLALALGPRVWRTMPGRRKLTLHSVRYGCRSGISRHIPLTGSSLGPQSALSAKTRQSGD
jgi:hypothetical protein